MYRDFALVAAWIVLILLASAALLASLSLLLSAVEKTYRALTRHASHEARRALGRRLAADAYSFTDHTNPFKIIYTIGSALADDGDYHLKTVLEAAARSGRPPDLPR